jgi:hypothetical protein
VLLRIMDVIKDAGVELAFPTRTLHIEAAAENVAPPSVLAFVGRS